MESNSAPRRRWGDGCCCGVYLLLWTLLHLCPVIGQLRALYILCHPSDYLKNEDEFERKQARVALILASYIVGYLLVWLLYRLGSFIYHHFFSKTFWRRHLAQTLGLLVVGKILYELFRHYGKLLQWSRRATGEADSSDTYSGCQKFMGFWALTLCTFGLYPVFWCLRWPYYHFKSEIFWRRHLAQTIYGLIVIKLVYELGRAYRKSLRWSLQATGEKSSETAPTGCQKFSGFWVLTLCTLGLYPLFWCLRWPSLNFKSEIFWRRHLAQTVYGLVVFKILYELGRGYLNLLDWSRYATTEKKPDTDQKDPNGCQKFWGFWALTLCSFGLYPLFWGLRWPSYHFHSKIFWRRHLAQTIYGLIVIKVLYELGRGYLNLVDWSLYATTEEDPEAGQKAPSGCQKFWGFWTLTLCSFGLYPIIWIGRWLHQNFRSPTFWRRHLSQTIYGLVVGKLIYELIRGYSYLWDWSMIRLYTINATIIIKMT